jgi:uncharacterized membrane protein
LGVAFLIAPVAVLLLFVLGFYLLARPREQPRWKKMGVSSRDDSILQVFEQQYKEGKITREQFKAIVRKYHNNGS